MCYLICRTYKFERGIIMLKFQNNDTTIIATFVRLYFDHLRYY